MTALVALRPKVAAALAPVAPTDPNVYQGYVDAIQPPALMLLPLSGRGDRTPCLFDVAGVVLMLSARVDPNAGMDTMDQLTSYVINRLGPSGEWNISGWTDARRFMVGGIVYLGALLTYTAMVDNG